MSGTRAGAVSAYKSGDKFEGRTEKVKIGRYFAGQKPDWVEDEEDDDLEGALNVRTQARGGDAENSSGFSDRAPQPADRRLQRMASSTAGDRAEAASERRRRVMEAEVLEGDDSDDEQEEARSRARARAAAREAAAADSSEEEEVEEDRDNRRARLRAQAHAREQEELLDVQEEENDVEEEESESEYETETESEDDMFGVRAIAKPVFVRKEERESIAERERLEALEEERENERMKRKESRKVETRQLVASEITKDQEKSMRADTANDEWDTMPNDNDDVDEAAEYEAWKIRELQRVKRDFDELAATEAEKVERQRRRGLTEEQILAEDKDAFKNTKKGMKGTQWKYLQKYYHRGAFFQDVEADGMAEPLYQRDFGGATLEDNYDKKAMPKIMQVKNFGKMSQVKWTHLADNDTTRNAEGKSTMLGLESNYVSRKLTERAKASGGSLERPSSKRVRR